MGMFIGADEIILLHEPNVADGLMVSSLGRALGVIYADVIKQPIPQPLAALLQKLHERTTVAAADLRRDGWPSSGAALKLYLITCKGCGSSARVTLEHIDPRTIELRCLLCASVDVSVAEVSGETVPRHRELAERPELD